MTTRRPDDAPGGDALRDPRFDAAWRKLSREEPPPALDAALRAAARREVGAAPRPTPAHVPSALRPQRWWWPLAAAATIGAIVIGLLQLAAPDRVAPTERAVVSDVPAPAPQPTRPEAQSEPPPPPKAKQAAALEEKREPPAANIAPSAQRPASPTVRKDAGQRSTPTESGVAAPAPLAEPFPAETANRVQALPAPPAAGAPLSKTESPPAAAEPQDKLAATPPAAMGSTQAPPPSPSTSYAPERRVQAQREVQRAAATAAAEERVARDAAARGGSERSEAGAAAHPPLPVPDWIALIRKLRDEGRGDEATKELAAFRRAHPDHEQLLPPDLRNWRPPAR